MLLGDISDYVKLLSIVKAEKPLEIEPSKLVLGVKGESELEDLSDDVQICLVPMF
jgi:nitrite reductase (NAD(P)H)